MSTLPAELQAPLLEKDFQKQVIDLAHLFQWRVAHFRPAMTKHGYRTAVQADGAGFPDLVMTRAGRLVVAELKAKKGRTSPDQKLWLGQFELIADECQNVEVYVWRPDDWDEVMEVLRPANLDKVEVK